MFGVFCCLVFEVTANFLISLARHVMYFEHAEKSQPYKQKPRVFDAKWVMLLLFTQIIHSRFLIHWEKV